MNNIGQFFLDFLSPFFKGLVSIFEAFFKGILQMFNIVNYISIISNHSKELTGVKVFFVVIAIVCLIALMGLLIFIIIRIVKRIIKIKRRTREQEMLMEEVENLNYENIKLKKENEKYLAMANGEVPAEGEENKKEENKEEEQKETGERFYRLCRIDEKWGNYLPSETNETINLKDICDQFRNYSASELKLFYRIDLIRLFISSFASNRLIILQGISGTGKTSLAYAMGDFLDNDSVIAPVQPSWRDRAELFGYFNEFTKKFNETELLTKMYEASYNDMIYISILDEMNIARVEYYFAEMLSIMEMPSFEQWVIDLVPNPWPNDPKKLIDGKFYIPKNMWYVGTINNDDSTFMVTDKVYDRALPIEINEKAPSFDAPHTEKLHIKSEYLMKLFKQAQESKPLSHDIIDKIMKMDDYVVKHFRLSFGNRIVQQMKNFIPVFEACGGNQIFAIDYLICHKILRKFEQLNMSYIRNEVDGFIEFLNQLFGEGNMKECINYLLELKKNV